MPASSLPHFEGEFCHGCNRAFSPDATPLNYGDWLLPAPRSCIHMHATGATHPPRVCCDEYASTYAVFHCRLCCCCGCASVSADRAPLDTTQVERDGGNASALPSLDRVGRGLASQGLSTSRVIPERPKCFTHCATQSLGRHSWGKAAPSARRTDERRH